MLAARPSALVFSSTLAAYYDYVLTKCLFKPGQATKLAYVCVWLHLDKHPSTEHAFLAGKRRIAAITKKLSLVPTLNNAKVPFLLPTGEGGGVWIRAQLRKSMHRTRERGKCTSQGAASCHPTFEVFYESERSTSGE